MKRSLFFLFILFPVFAQAQIGGYGVFKFVNLPPSSRIAALGGTQVAVRDADVTMVLQNPALLSDSMHNRLALSYIDYLESINNGSIVYARSLDSMTTLMGGFQYLNYGQFIRADELGNLQGTFSAGEYAFMVGASRMWKHNISFGAQMKLMLSQLESYSSFAAAVDLGASYVSKSGNFSSGLVLKNIGYQFVKYDDERESLPFDIQLGVAMKPEHLPLRLSITLHDLQHFDLTYINNSQPPRRDLLTGEIIEEKVPFSEKIARHFIIGGEILITDNFHLRVGYNHQRRKEMTIPDFRGAVGYSFGFGLKLSKFHISYGRSIYHLSAASNTFTLATNFSEWFRKGNTGGGADE